MSCDIWQPFESDQRADGGGRTAGVAQCLSVLQAITMIMNCDYVVHKKHEGFYGLQEPMNHFEVNFDNSEALIERHSTHLLMVIACSTLRH